MVKFVAFILFIFTFHVLQAKTYSDTIVSEKNKKEAKMLIEGGKILFEEKKYRLALIEFKAASQKDRYNNLAIYWLSKAHFQLNNYGYSLQYARQLNQNTGFKNGEFVFQLAQSFHQLSYVDSALICYQLADSMLKKAEKKEKRISELMESCSFYKTEIDTGKISLRKTFSSDINSSFHDYAAHFIKDGKELYFTSRRENTTGGRSNPDDEQYFEDNYHAVWSEDEKKWINITNNLERLNGQGFDCISYITNDGLKGLMTLNTTAVQNIKDPTKSSDICEIAFSDKGKWQSPKLIDNKSINSDFFDGSATMTADGNTMYFVSDRKGKTKSTDIYVVQKEGNKWGEAKPVSDSINTPFRETTPFISPDGRFLFFSSDGHKGLGGYDIFVSENLGETWTKPVNLGFEINSVNDDTHFEMYPKLKKAIFSSITHEFLKSNIDIFEVSLEEYKIPKTIK